MATHRRVRGAAVYREFAPALETLASGSAQRHIFVALRAAAGALAHVDTGTLVVHYIPDPVDQRHVAVPDHEVERFHLVDVVNIGL